jgi:hypothetical protein
MEMVLADNGWTTYRITPYGDLEWIDELWLPTLRRALKKPAAD